MTDCRLTDRPYLVRFTGDPDQDRWCPPDEPCDVHKSWDARPDGLEKDLIRVLNVEMATAMNEEMDRDLHELMHGDGTGEIKGIFNTDGITAYEPTEVVAAQDLEWKEPHVTTNPIVGGKISFAPVGTDPSDRDAFVDLGHMLADSISFAPAEPPEPVDMFKAINEARTMILEADYQPSPEALGMFYGIPVIESDYVPRSMHALIVDHGIGLSIVAPQMESREFTDLEREGEWAKRAVRHGLADVLAWLGEDVGPEPDLAYTDYLMKMNFTAGLKVGAL